MAKIVNVVDTKYTIPLLLLKAFIVRHGWGIFFAVFVGLCVGLPSLLAPYALGADYHGMQFLYVDDDVSYRARIHEILDGHFAVRSPAVYEYKDGKSLIPPINEYFYALPAVFFGLSTVVTASKFIFPGVLFFLMYLLARRLMRCESVSHSLLEALPPIAAAFAGFLITDPSGIFRLFNFLLGNDPSLHVFPWTRLVNPITGGILLFAFLLVLESLVRNPQRRYVVLGSLLLGASVGYFFSFALGICISGILLLFVLIVRDKQRLLFLIGLFVVTALIDFPYFYVVAKNIGGDAGMDFAGRNGMLFTHEPVFNKVILITLAIVLCALAITYLLREWQRYRVSWIFIFALLLGSLAALNHQIITGRAIWYHHFTHYTVPISMIVLVSVCTMVLQHRIGKLLAYFLGVIVVFSSAYLIASAGSYQYVIDHFYQQQKRADVIAYLNQAAPPECVVFIPTFDDPVEIDIPAYTSCNVYHTPYVFTGITTERILHNVLLKMRFAGVTEEHMRGYLLSNIGQVRKYFFTNWNENFGVGIDDWVMGRIQMVEAAYRTFLSGELKDQLLTYRMDYLLSRHPLSDQLLHQLPGLRLDRSFSDYFLYVFDASKTPSDQVLQP